MVEAQFTSSPMIAHYELAKRCSNFFNDPTLHISVVGVPISYCYTTKVELCCE